MSNFNVDPKDVLRFQIERNVKNIMRSYLILLEEVENEHDNALNKLDSKLPDQYKIYVELADYLDEDKAKRLRKQILDNGNDAIRAIEEVIKQFDIDFKR